MENTTEIEWRNKDMAVVVVDGGMSDSSSVSTDITYNPFRSYDVLKRLFDVVFAALSTAALLPVFLVVAICIKLEDGGSIFYLRETVGLQGHRFFALKFRTMIRDAEEYLAKRPDLMQKYQQNMKLASDPRVTRFGKFLRKTNLDELPQVFNILMGQMSLVGPRIIHPSELPRYGEFAQKRLSIRPGITGLWQISPDRHRCYEDRIPLDMEYVDNRSFMLDLVILSKTLRVLIKFTGI